VREHIGQVMTDASQNPKYAHLIAMLTTSVGVSTIFEILPKVTGVVAGMSGIVLTWVLICKARVETKKIEMEMREERDKEQK
jgi:hypothetical protein